MVFRKRLVYWLLKEYLRKWGKTILFFFLIGLVIFFGLKAFFSLYKPVIPKMKKESIGIVGAYTPDALPPVVLQDLSRGLTKIDTYGKIQPDLAASWQIKNGGKTYIFTLKPHEYFSNGKNVTSESINYNFSDANVKRTGKYTIIYTLKVKDGYTPFLTTVSKPILQNGFVGAGKNKIKNIKLNGDFVQSIELISIDGEIKKYQFYPTADSLKTAFLLGEITKAQALNDDTFRNTSFASFPNTYVTKSVDTTQLVTLFYNTKDAHLSQRDVRAGLTYALPDIFSFGERSYTLYPKSSWAYTTQFLYSQDLAHAKLLTADLRASKSGSLILSIKTLPKYKDTAETIAKEWEKIGIHSIIDVVDTVPTDFQIFLGDFNLPKDPDQYMLWHTNQENNISKYENKRIDKLLEDGRKTPDGATRRKIYSDFQKYLLADAPAAFLYFPYSYTLIRK